MSYLSSLPSRTKGHGGVCQGGSGPTLDCSFHITCVCRVLLCGKERRRPLSLNWLFLLETNNTYVPLSSPALEQLRCAHIYIRLNLRSVYNFIHIWADDEWKTAFRTTSGYYQYQDMLYGLACASVFQCFINNVLRDFLGKYVIAYINDILTYSPKIEKHIQHIRAILQKLLKNHLYVKGEKCEFHVIRVSFLAMSLTRMESLWMLTRLSLSLSGQHPVLLRSYQVSWVLLLSPFYNGVSGQWQPQLLPFSRMGPRN